MKAVVGARVSLPKSEVGVSTIKKELTVKVWDHVTEKTTLVKTFTETRTHLHVPRQVGLRYIDEYGLEVDWRVSSGYEAFLKVQPISLYPYQEPWVQEILTLFRNGEVDITAMAATGKGKCLGIDTPVLMYDGSVKKVQNINKDDLLIGPDSKPRNVLSRTKGYGPLYRIIPTKGQPFVCNDEHVLSLQRVAKKKGDKREGEVVNLTVLEYLECSKNFKHIHKLWRSGVVYEERYVLPYDPYIIGLYLGDGASHNCNITVAYTEPEIRNEVFSFARSIGLHIREEEGRGCDTLFITCGKKGGVNKFREYVSDELHNYKGDKIVPQEYKVSSREERLSVLAGLVDSDGSLSCNCYDYVSKYRTLAEDVLYLARSVGLAAYMQVTTKSCKGFSGEYYRINISGDIDEIPSLVKKAKIRKQKKSVLRTGFTVEYIGKGEYYGFEIDSDRLFMLGDFTVTHNTVMSLEVMRELGSTALVFVDQDFLRDQWISNAKKFLKLKDSNIGIIQGSVCDYSGKDLVIAMVQTVYNKEYPDSLYNYFGTVAFDESHTLGAEQFSKVLGKFTAEHRLAVSATPDRTDALQKVLEFNVGPTKVELKDKHLASIVRYVEYDGVLSWYSNISPKGGRYLNEIAADSRRNALLSRIIQYLYGTGRPTLVVSDRIEHLEYLMSLCYYLGVPEAEMGLISGYENVWKYAKDPTPPCRPYDLHRGSEYTPVKLQQVKKRIPTNRLDVVKQNAIIIFATYGKFTKGVDVPRLCAGVDCTPRAKAQQLHGRILRVEEGKMIPMWVTIRDTMSYKAEYQFGKRLVEYIKSSAEIVQWQLGRGTRKREVTDLLQQVGHRVKILKQAEIVTNVDGNYIVVMKSTGRRPSKEVERPTGRTTRQRRK